MSFSYLSRSGSPFLPNTLSTLLNGGSRHFVTVSKTLSKILRQLVAGQSNAICTCVYCLLSTSVNHIHIAHCLQLIDCGINLYIQKEQLSLLDEKGHPSLFAPIMIATLSTCAQLERDNISFRLQSGRKRYIEKGGKLGRKVGSVKTEEQMKAEYREVVSLLRKGYSIRDVAKLSGKGLSTVQRVKRLLKVQSPQ